MMHPATEPVPIRLHKFNSLRFPVFGVALIALFLAGCATPIGVTRLSPEASYRLSTVNPLGEGVLSNSARAVLQRYNLNETFTDDPKQVIRVLSETVVHDDRRDLLFALAELSYHYGDRLRGSSSCDDLARAPDSFLLSAVYAYLYLLGDGKGPPPTAFDIRFREACDLYNRALWRAFPANEDGALDIRGGVRKLPVGTLNITLKTDKLSWKLDAFEGFLPADAYKIHGLTVRNRTPGMGLPLIGVTKKTKESPNGGVLPVTAFLRVAGGVRELATGGDSATLELYSAYDDAEVKVNGRTVPLETDSTTPLAYKLNAPELWSLGLKRFISGGRIDKRLLLMQPYEPGRIPVVLVHGTASSPVWWAEMINTLRADPTIRKRYQFWFFQFDSSNMILFSAADLRDTLADMVKKVDPQGKDPALRQMVVIGHSLGGLLTKMSVVATGDRLWKAISDKSIDEMDVDEEFRELVHRMVFFEPLPFVKRVVFISTPHRGSFLSTDLVRSLVRTLVTIPVNIITLNPKLFTQFTAQLKLPPSIRNRVVTSVDGMSPENPVLQALVTIPLAPGVKGHSIVAVLPGMEIETGNDGVVEYQSAHINGVESEFIVRFGHSCQGYPFTIEEVRRILMEHLGVEVAGPEEIQTLRQPDSPPPPGAATAAPQPTEAPVSVAVPAAAAGK